MTLIKYEPFRGFEGIARRFNDFFSGFERNANFDMPVASFVPKIDVTEDDKYIFVHADLPGMGRDEVKVTVNEDGLLSIKGEKKEEIRKEDKTIIRLERHYGQFSRSFVLPENVSKENIDAKFDKGVLELKLEKIEPEKPKEIEVTLK
jgi:HSP20 family protein